MLNKIVLIFLCCLLSEVVLAQEANKLKFLEIGISPLSYKGDLSQGYQKWTSAFNIGLKRNEKKRFNSHINLMIGKISGQNPDYSFENQLPNKYFKTSVYAVNYDLHFNLIKKEKFILYLSQGIGVMSFKTKDENNKNLIDKNETRAKNETYNTLSFIFPHSIGLIYLLPNYYGVGFQAGRLVPTTDYLDNISDLSTYKRADNIMMFKFYLLFPLGKV